MLRANSLMNVVPGDKALTYYANNNEGSLVFNRNAESCLQSSTTEGGNMNIQSIPYAFRVIVRCIALFAAIFEWAAAF